MQRALVEHFAAGTPARTAAELVQINRRSVTLYYHKLREIIAAQLALEAPDFQGEVEADESYFGGIRKGKRGRGAAGKVVAFGLLKRCGKVHVVTIDDTRSGRLSGIMREYVRPDSVVSTDAYSAYDNRSSSGTAG